MRGKPRFRGKAQAFLLQNLRKGANKKTGFREESGFLSDCGRGLLRGDNLKIGQADRSAQFPA